MIRSVRTAADVYARPMLPEREPRPPAPELDAVDALRDAVETLAAVHPGLEGWRVDVDELAGPPRRLVVVLEAPRDAAAEHVAAEADAADALAAIAAEPPAPKVRHRSRRSPRRTLATFAAIAPADGRWIGDLMREQPLGKGEGST